MDILNHLGTWKRSAFVFPCTSDASQPRNDQVRTFWRGRDDPCRSLWCPKEPHFGRETREKALYRMSPVNYQSEAAEH